jgi:hypothetical protein
MPSSFNAHQELESLVITYVSELVGLPPLHQSMSDQMRPHVVLLPFFSSQASQQGLGMWEEGPIYLPIVKELKIAGSINGYKKQLTHCTRFDPYLLSFA